MIQRIQSLYLLIIFGLTLAMFFFPLACFIGGTEEFRITLWGIKSVLSGEKIIPAIPMGALAVVACTIAFVTIFLYRKRRMQIRLCVVQIILQAGLQALVVLYLLKAGTIAETEISTRNYSVITIFPIINIILAYLAYRGVVKDEKLIKSLDRIR